MRWATRTLAQHTHCVLCKAQHRTGIDCFVLPVAWAIPLPARPQNHERGYLQNIRGRPKAYPFVCHSMLCCVACGPFASRSCKAHTLPRLFAKPSMRHTDNGSRSNAWVADQRGLNLACLYILPASLDDVLQPAEKPQAANRV
jgi:hypothetical protein